jgi:hypothetical protein
VPDVAAEGVYSVEGQEALANELAFGTSEAPEDDGGVFTDGGEAFDSGEGRSPDAREGWQSHRLTPADEARLEVEAEQTAQFLEQAESEQAVAEQEAAYSEALDRYSKLSQEEQFEVSLESVGRGLEAIAPVVNAEQAQVLNQELFAGGADAVPMASTLAFFANNVLETLASSGLEDISQLTPEVAQQLTDPAMATLFAQSICGALRVPELLTDGIVNPMEMSAELLPYVPILLSGQSADLYPKETKLAFAQSVCRAFGEKHAARTIDPDAAVALFDQWAKWGGRLSAGLQYHRQQAQHQPQPSRSVGRSARSSRQARPSGMFRTNDDLYAEGVAVWNERHAGV